MHNKRYIANIVIEAKTPLKVGSSDIDMLQDAPVQKDFNDLPMILGTSIAGVLRKLFNKQKVNDIFGDEESKKKDAKGSRLIVSNALLCDADMQVHEKPLIQKSDFLKLFDTLPIRDHTAITDKGVAKESAKFDEEVVYKGSRFRFSLELIGDQEDETAWQELLSLLNTHTFRLGSGVTKGFGEIAVVHEASTWDLFDVTSKEYRTLSSSLNTTLSRAFPKESTLETNYTKYTLKLTPQDFFIFGSGFGDDDADMTPVYEKVIDYDKKDLSKEMILIPASSIKGAIAHRAVFYFNKQNGLYIGNPEARTSLPEIFGEAKEEEKGHKGKVLMSDCFSSKANEKVFDHVAIDRFTGGAIDGALFQEKTVADTQSYTIEIFLEKEIDKPYIEAFEAALLDIANARLPLGGTTTKGHGFFSGKVLKDGEEL